MPRAHMLLIMSLMLASSRKRAILNVDMVVLRCSRRIMYALESTPVTTLVVRNKTPTYVRGGSQGGAIVRDDDMLFAIAMFDLFIQVIEVIPE